MCEGVGQVCLFIIPRTPNPTASVDSYPAAHCHNTPASFLVKSFCLERVIKLYLHILALILITALFINRLYC